MSDEELEVFDPSKSYANVFTHIMNEPVKKVAASQQLPNEIHGRIDKDQFSESPQSNMIVNPPALQPVNVGASDSRPKIVSTEKNQPPPTPGNFPLITPVNRPLSNPAESKGSNIKPILPSSGSKVQIPKPLSKGIMPINPVPAKKQVQLTSVSEFSCSLFPFQPDLQNSQNIIFSTEHLHSISNSSATPLVIPCNPNPLPLEFNSLLRNIIPNIQISEDLIMTSSVMRLASENEDLLPVIRESLYCVCGNPGTVKLDCRHALCNQCSVNTVNCPLCCASLSQYQLNLPSYQCLKCHSVKDKKLICKHYCLDCVIHKLKFRSSFLCMVCNYHFEKKYFEGLDISCTGCGISGKYLEESYHEICNGHILCYSCFKVSVKAKICKVCNRQLSQLEIISLKKCTKFSCDLCITRKRLTMVKVRKCCNSKLCVKCQTSNTCAMCGAEDRIN